MRPYRRSHRSPAAQAVQSAIWMIGLGILFFTGDWWPGIMIVLGVSAVAGALVSMMWPGGAQVEPPHPSQQLPTSVAPPQPSNIGRAETVRVQTPPALQSGERERNGSSDAHSASQAQASLAPARVAVRLPEICPQCGAPPRSLPNRSDNPNACPYCGTDLRPV
ncbi:MAG: zinc ribbon domain-containing protein [Anaerolineales bacterium]